MADASEPFKEQLLSLHRDQRNFAAPGLALTHLAWLAAMMWVAWLPSSLSILVAIVVIGVMQYRLVMSCHEAVHKTLLFPTWLNEIIGLLHASMVGVNFIRYRRQHDGHHRAHQVHDDPDGYIYEPVLRARPGWRRAAVWVGGAVVEIAEKFRQKGLAVNESPRDQRRARRHSAVIVAVQLALLIVLSWRIGWWAYPLLWLTPLLTVALFLNRTRVIIEHGWPYAAGLLDPDEVGDLDQMTIDVLTNPLERFILAPFCFNYHYAHHSIQTIPHYHNEQLSQLLEKQGGERSRRVRATYLGLLSNILWGKPCHELQVQPPH